MAKEIPLTHGRKAIVDDEDYSQLAQHKWQVVRGYVVRLVEIDGNRKLIQMHRAVASPPDDMQVDHINGDKLDNRRSNLRACTQSQNVRNRPTPRHNTSGFKGVSWDKKYQKWYAYIKVNRKLINLGRHDTAEKAAEAYNKAALRYHGEFAWLNKLPARAALAQTKE